MVDTERRSDGDSNEGDFKSLKLYGCLVQLKPAEFWHYVL
jgi:hypothetical protein